MVQVTDVKVSTKAGAQTLSGLIDGHAARFCFPADVAVSARGEPFVGIALLQAMSQGTTLALEPSAPLDPKLVSRLPLIQSILQQWIPSLTRVAITCCEAPLSVTNTGVLTSFSGGVDSSCTLLDHLDEITHLLTLNAFDEASAAGFEPLKAKVGATARRLGKVLTPVETNARELCEAFSISWNLAHGPVMCLTAAALGFQRFYVPSSFTFRDLKPWGSHPVLDPLWSTGTTEIVYDGAQRTRTQKIEEIVNAPDLLGQLQVCWNSQVDNCGRCSKCARTMLVLETLDARGAPFPRRPIEALIAGVKLKTDLGAAFAVDLIDFFDRRRRPDLAELMRSRLRRFRVRQQLRRLVKDAAGAERISALRRRFKPNEEIKTVRILDPEDAL